MRLGFPKPFFLGGCKKNTTYSFVAVSDNYIAYLQTSEPHVMPNKTNTRIYHRKYIGIIEELNGFKYFVPLSSPKAHDYLSNGKIKKDSLVTIHIKDNKNLFATLKFNNMIPVPESEIINFDLNSEGDLKYKLILLNELFFIRKNGYKIEATAKNLYKAKVNQSNEPASKQAVLNITLDFSKLEKLCLLWHQR